MRVRWYVLGESMRQRLQRLTQLGVDEALNITRCWLFLRLGSLPAAVRLCTPVLGEG